MTKQPFRFTLFLLMCLALPLTATAHCIKPVSNVGTEPEHAIINERKVYDLFQTRDFLVVN